MKSFTRFKKILNILAIMIFVLISVSCFSIDSQDIKQAQAAASFVQTATNSAKNASTVTATFSAGATANNILIAVLGARDNVTINTPGDWSTAINQSGTPGQAIFYKTATGGETSVTVTTATSSGSLGLHIYEYSNGTVLDKTDSATGNSTTPTSGSITTSENNQLIFAAFTDDINTNHTDGSWTDDGFTERNDFKTTPPPGLNATYAGGDNLTNTSGSSISTTTTIGSTANWRGQIVSFTTAIVNGLPVASSVSIDGGAASINLTENTTTSVVCTATVTDDDGYADITSVEAKLYRTSVGAGAADDNNDHYTFSGDAQCVPSGGSGTTENYTCTFAVQYYADPTDVGSPYEADDWTCQLTPTDTVGAGTADTDTIEMNSLVALDVTATIAYGELALGTDTGAVNQTVTITNTGNRAIDPEVSGTAISCTIGSIPVGNQEYSDVAFTWGVGGTDLSVTPTRQELTLPQRTDDATPVIDDVEWGMGMPATGVGGSCSGTNTFTAVAD